ncbi:MAG: NAD-dependent deacylase [Bacteroidetes bacterium]|nr:NAD-dependent deacylase [Bacteroidota bacterium]
MEFRKDFFERLKTAKNILFFTGAGISAESGIATFRGKDGLWNKLKPEELANFNAFMKNPDMVWEWYQYRREIINETKPNLGHYTIVEFEKYFEKVDVVTQNVDNLHGRAGSSSIYELHGNIERNFCVDCKTFYNKEDLLGSEKVPRCTKCNGLIRPDVVWFGEMLPAGVFEKSEQLAMNSDITFVVGTSAVVYPAAYIPISAKQGGAYVVEINLDGTEISGSVDYSLRGKSGEILPEILNIIKEQKGAV